MTEVRKAFTTMIQNEETTEETIDKINYIKIKIISREK